jgi:tetratricopeptide (TPR) repeat protein
MTKEPVIFISAVSKELRSARALASRLVHSLGYEPRDQDMAATEAGLLIDVLRRWIDASKSVIQLVGDCYGAEPTVPTPEFGRVSYTQFEALYAQKQGKPVYYLFVGNSFTPDAHDPEPTELHDLQQTYRQNIKANGDLRHQFNNTTELENRLHRLRDELARLRQQSDQREAQLHRKLALVVLLALVLLFGIVWVKRDLWQQTKDSSETKAVVTNLQAQNDKLLQALRDLPETLSQQAQGGQKEDETTRMARSYATLEDKLNLPKGTLEKELPHFAEQLLARADTSTMDRANALFATKKFAEAEAEAVKAKNHALATAGQPLQDAISALRLAGESAKAQIHYSQALEYYRAAAVLTDEKRDPTQWAEVQWDIARVLQDEGKDAEAAELYRRVLPVYMKKGGTDILFALGVLANLAISLNEQGDHVKAEEIDRLVLENFERVAGAKHPITLKVRNNLANTLKGQGKYAEAEVEHRAVLKLREGALGAEHPDTLSSRDNLANVLRAQGKLEDAEMERRIVLKVGERVLGAEHPDTLTNRNNRAAVMRELGQNAEAEQESRAVLKLRERVLGAEDSETLNSRMGLALALQAQGKHAEAEQEHRAVLKARESVLGAESPDVALSCYMLGRCLLAQNKLPETLAFMQKAEQVWTKALGPENPKAKAAKDARVILEKALAPK